MYLGILKVELKFRLVSELWNDSLNPPLRRPCPHSVRVADDIDDNLSLWDGGAHVVAVSLALVSAHMKVSEHPTPYKAE